VILADISTSLFLRVEVRYVIFEWSLTLKMAFLSETVYDPVTYSTGPSKGPQMAQVLHKRMRLALCGAAKDNGYRVVNQGHILW